MQQASGEQNGKGGDTSQAGRRCHTVGFGRSEFAMFMEFDLGSILKLLRKREYRENIGCHLVGNRLGPTSRNPFRGQENEFRLRSYEKKEPIDRFETIAAFMVITASIFTRVLKRVRAPPYRHLDA